MADRIGDWTYVTSLPTLVSDLSLDNPRLAAYAADAISAVDALVVNLSLWRNWPPGEQQALAVVDNIHALSIVPALRGAEALATSLYQLLDWVERLRGIDEPNDEIWRVLSDIRNANIGLHTMFEALAIADTYQRIGAEDRDEAGIDPGQDLTTTDDLAALAAATAVLYVSIAKSIQEANGETPVPRRAEFLTAHDTGRVISALEPTIAAVTSAAHDGLMSDETESTVTNILKQLALIRERDDGRVRPQQIELLIAELVDRLWDRMWDVRRLEAEFGRLGADAGTAAVAAERVATAVEAMRDRLGSDDPVEDAAVGAEIAQVADDVDTLIEQLAKDGAHEAAKTLGKTATGGAITLVTEHRSQIWVALTSFWRMVRPMFWPF
ncbi:MAG: hypothetical protein JWL72_3841 [Ilumatobacteraceae bacterium]|nr:hypothetical protein [Ilumatobacteraceae bacterium]MCU1390503.1 hypothetical protein [Ilumatobacteraceae bacterium]